MRTHLKWLRLGVFCGALIGASSVLVCVGIVYYNFIFIGIGIAVMIGAAVLQEVLLYFARKERDGDESRR